MSTVCVLWRPPRRMPGDSAASPPSASRTRSCAEFDQSCTRPALTARLGWRPIGKKYLNWWTSWRWLLSLPAGNVLQQRVPTGCSGPVSPGSVFRPVSGRSRPSHQQAQRCLEVKYHLSSDRPQLWHLHSPFFWKYFTLIGVDMSSVQKYALPPRDLQYYANGQNGCYRQAGEFPRFAARTDSYWLSFCYTSNYAKPQQHNSKVLMETPTFQTTPPILLKSFFYADWLTGFQTCRYKDTLQKCTFCCTYASLVVSYRDTWSVHFKYRSSIVLVWRRKLGLFKLVIKKGKTM